MSFFVVINTHFRYFYGGYIGKYIEINIFSNIFSILFDKKNPSFQGLFHYSAEQFTALISVFKRRKNAEASQNIL